MNNSPKVRTEAPNHDDIKIPTRKMKVMDVTNPRPAQIIKFCNKIFLIFCRRYIFVLKFIKWIYATWFCKGYCDQGPRAFYYALLQMKRNNIYSEAYFWELNIFRRLYQSLRNMHWHWPWIICSTPKNMQFLKSKWW